MSELDDLRAEVMKWIQAVKAVEAVAAEWERTGISLSHADAAGRIRLALASFAPVHEWWDADHDRAADGYTPPERAYCRRCGGGRSFYDGLDCRPMPTRAMRTPRPPSAVEEVAP